MSDNYETNDKKLIEAIEKFQNGDDAAFRAVYDNSVRYINYSILMSLQDKGLAEDILQETYLEVYKNLKNLKEPQYFKKWAAVIAHNKISRYYRNNRDNVFSSEEEMDNVIGSEEEENADMLPEDAIDNQETQRLILDIINGLPEIQRETVVSFYYNQMSISEISDALGVPENTTKTNLSRGRKKIKEGVLELEKKHGTKLYTIPIMAVLSGLFAKDAMASELPVNGITFIESESGVATASGTIQGSIVKGAAATASKAVGIKWALIAAAGLLAVGAGTGVALSMNGQKKTESVAIESSTEEVFREKDPEDEDPVESDSDTETNETDDEISSESEEAIDEEVSTEEVAESEPEIDYNEDYYREMMKDISGDPIVAICVDDFDGDGVNGAFVETVPEGTNTDWTLDFVTSSLYYLEKDNYTEIFTNEINYSTWFDQIKMDTDENILAVPTLSSDAWAPDRNFDHTLYIVKDDEPICLGTTVGAVGYKDGELYGSVYKTYYDAEMDLPRGLYTITPYTIVDDKLVSGEERDEFED